MFIGEVEVMFDLKALRQPLALPLLLLALLSTSVPSAAQEPAATSWTLQSGSKIAPGQLQMPELQMKGQVLSGSTGCNTFTATLSTQPDGRVGIAHLTMSQAMPAKAEGGRDRVRRSARADEVSGKERPNAGISLGKTRVAAGLAVARQF
jgi:hypothetical protein